MILLEMAACARMLLAEAAGSPSSGACVFVVDTEAVRDSSLSEPWNQVERLRGDIVNMYCELVLPDGLDQHLF